MGSAYDHEPRRAPSPYLRLGNKDDSVTIRIASEPYREPKVWLGEPPSAKPVDSVEIALWTPETWADVMRDPTTDYNINEAYSWVVIDRSDGRAKVFSGSPSVYKNIKNYATMPEWGDPKEYDIKITRTEDPGRNYYTVMALPNKSALTADEKTLVGALDMSTLSPNARLLTEPQIDAVGNPEDHVDVRTFPTIENTMKHTPGVADKKDAVAEVSDEPINLDDIPF